MVSRDAGISDSDPWTPWPRILTRPEADEDADSDDEDLAARSVPEPARYAEEPERTGIDPDAVKVIKRLTRHGHAAYLVGGGVRDLLLGRRPKDFDVATSARPEDVRRLFRNCRVIGRRFRLAHILFGGGKIIEVATFRRDPMQAFEAVENEIAEELDADVPAVLSPARKDRRDDADLLIRHDNVFGEPHEDAMRRDFTINGLFYDIEHDEVIDYVGGVPRSPQALRAHHRRPGRALPRGSGANPSRDQVLRAARPRDRSRALRRDGRAPRGAPRAARPRVLEEIFRLLRGGAAHRSVWLMWDTGVLAVILPELASCLDDEAPGAAHLWSRLDAVDHRARDGRLPNDSVLLAALLVGPLAESIEDASDPSSSFEDFFEGVTARIAVPRRIKDRVRSIALAQRRLESGKLGALPRRDFFSDAALLYALDCEARDQPVPAWADEPESVETDSLAPRRRRRRRRRR